MGGEHAASLSRVGPGPQQVAERGVIAGPGQLLAEQLVAEAEVVEDQVLAVVVSVPYPRPEQNHVPDLQPLLSPPGNMGAGPGCDEGDLDKTVRVQGMRVVVEVVTA